MQVEAGPVHISGSTMASSLEMTQILKQRLLCPGNSPEFSTGHTGRQAAWRAQRGAWGGGDTEILVPERQGLGWELERISPSLSPH